MTLEEKIKKLQETKEDLQLLLWLQELQVFREELENGKLFQVSKPEYRYGDFVCPYCGCSLYDYNDYTVKDYIEEFGKFCLSCGLPLDLE